MMRRAVALTLAAGLIFGSVGCSEQDDGADQAGQAAACQKLAEAKYGRLGELAEPLAGRQVEEPTFDYECSRDDPLVAVYVSLPPEVAPDEALAMLGSAWTYDKETGKATTDGGRWKATATSSSQEGVDVTLVSIFD